VEPHDRCEQRPRLIPALRMGRMQDESNSTGLLTMSTSSGLKRGPSWARVPPVGMLLTSIWKREWQRVFSGTRTVLESVRLASSV
jgi:hypothetical protein